MRALSAIALGTALLLGASSARADEGTADVAAVLEEEVVTTASRSAQRAADTPAFSRAITAEEIRHFGIRSLDEALDFLGVGIRTSHGAGIPEVGARGVFRRRDLGNHVLLLVDGHIMNEPLYGSAQFGPGLGVPLEMIDHIEVVLGPGSVMYGSNAVFAVVNVVTKSASTNDGTHVAAEVSTHAADEVTPLSSTRMTATGGYRFDLFGKRTELTLGVSYYWHNAIPFQVGPQNIGIDPADGQPMRFTRTGPYNGVWGGNYKGMYLQEVPSAYVRLTRGQFEVLGGASWLTSRDPTRGSSNFDEPLAKAEPRAFLSIRQGLTLSRIVELRGRVFGDLYGFQSDFIASRTSSCSLNPIGTTCNHRVIAGSRRGGVELQANLDWRSDHRITTLFTAMGTLNNVYANGETYDVATNTLILPLPETFVQSQTRTIVAASAEQGWQPFDWLGLSAGARVDKDERFAAVLSPRFAVTTRPWEDGTLKAVYAEAFRGPSFYETEARSPILLSPSRGLLPEKTDSRELIFEQRLGRHRLALGVFDTRFRQLVDLVTLTPGEAADAVARGLTPVPFSPAIVLEQYRNLTTVRSDGFTLSADAAALDGRLRFGGSFTGAVAREPNGNLVPVAPRTFGNLRTSYDFGGQLPTLAVAATFAGRTVVDVGYDGNFQPLPFAPGQFELRGTVSGKMPGVHGLSYRVIGNYAFQDRLPYAIGPANKSIPTVTQPELAPSKRLEVTLGLQYDF
jgi:outer membrane receptor protein involved in Fe transport